MPHALLVDDDAAFRDALAAVVRKEGFTVETAGTLAEGRARIAERIPDLALVDVTLPDGTGLDLLPAVRDAPGVEFVLITGHATVSSVIAALRQGVTDYLTKPVDLERIRSVLVNVARRRELHAEIADLRAELRQLGRFGPMIGRSPAMTAVYDMISRVAPSEATVLVLGESGTGKELAARTIHELSRRRRQPFVALNCGAVSPQLIESELFGHERGSFTGADRAHRGYFERASGSTLFLDEITEMPLELQTRLLRVLETGTVTRIGGEKEIPVDVRIVAASNRDPEAAVADGKLRQDLLYRLSVFPLQLPPLRERTGDIALIAEEALAGLNAAEGTSKRLTRAALETLAAYAWPGNVRELRNVVQRAFILADREIDAGALTPLLRITPAQPAAPAAAQTHPTLEIELGISIEDAERRLILGTLDFCDGVKEKAAAVLGISLKTLYNKLRTYKTPE
jgi:DNA-binding NtrC family response regulator